MPGGGTTTTTNFTVPSGEPLPIILGGNGSPVSSDLELKIEPLQLEIKPLQAAIRIDPLQLTTNAKVESDSKIDAQANVSSDSRSLIDLKPVAMDTCTTFKLAPLPAVCVEQPYAQHFGFTFMGMELWGFNLSGHSQTVLRSPSSGQPPETKHCEPQRPQSSSQTQASRPPSGLRVRVG